MALSGRYDRPLGPAQAGNGPLDAARRWSPGLFHPRKCASKLWIWGMSVEGRSLMPLRSTRAVFMRGGTSNAIMFRSQDPPPNRADRDAIFLAAMGSPDPNGRQLDGMGGGVSSLSRVCIVGAPTRPDADVDYTFAQISIETPVVDYSSNCGNMSSAVGPFAVDEGLVPAPTGAEATIRIHNTNTGKIIVARFP